jgi:hypothetical protein
MHSAYNVKLGAESCDIAIIMSHVLSTVKYDDTVKV